MKKCLIVLLAMGMVLTSSGCGILTTTKKIIERNETQTQTQETDNQIIENYELATLVPASDILAEIPYIGDRSICKMDRVMALAYKDAIESMPEHTKDYPDYNLCALLADPTGDGMPILITAYVYPEKYEYSFCEKDYGNFVEVHFWEYRDGKAKRVDIPRPDYDNGFGKIGNKTYYRNIDFYHDAGNKRTGVYYLIENATIKLVHTVDLYDVLISKDNDYSYGDLPEGATYERISEDLRENGWRLDDTEYTEFWHLAIHNGKDITDTYTGFDHDEVVNFKQTIEFVHADDANYHLDVKNDKGTNVAKNLEKYSKSVGRPSYRYRQIASELAKDKLGGIVKAVEGIISGTIGEIYQLSEDIYYVVIYADEELAGGVLLKNTNGGNSWRPISSGSEPMSETELDKKTENDLKTANITIDKKTENTTEALKNAIANVDGTTVNDTAKNEIADYISHCIAQAGKRTVKASRNTLKITEKTVKKCIKEASEKRAEITEVLEESEVSLNKIVYTDILVECENMSDNKEVKIVFDEDIINAVKDFDLLTIKINGTLYSIMMTSDKLVEIANKTIGIQKTGKYTYVIRFADEDGQIIDYIGNGITITLPADNEFCTIQLEYKGGTDNWGGQYDAQKKRLIFEAPYSGTYTVIGNEAEIADIDELTDEQKKAVKFMVSKGYMTLNADKFNPSEILTRYQFTQAIVGMFFALDRDLTTTFTDVPAESEFYPYVASAQKDNIVEGFTDTEFAGNSNMTTEQMVALAGRTLMKYKGYTAPEDAESYLECFTDKDKISDWARELVAIAVREGLVDRTSEFKPQGEITRAQAAVILYRLFLLLYEIEPEAESVAASVDVTKTVVVSICAVVAIACIIAIIILLRKRKK